MENTVLVWFVGVFSQVDLYSTDIVNATLNEGLIREICGKYSTVYCIISIKDKEEQFKFEQLIASNEDLLKCKFIFIPYVNFSQVLTDCPTLGTVSTFIDSNSSRLWNMRKIYPKVECLHLSKFVN